MKLGNLDIEKIYLGSDADVKVYLGDVKVYPSEEPTHDYYQDYLTIESLEDNNTVFLKASKTSAGIAKTESASTDNGETWVEYGIYIFSSKK